jgi:uncharacterized membrane protein
MSGTQGAAPDAVYRNVLRVLRAGFRLAALLLLVGIAVSILRGEELAGTADPFGEVLPRLFEGHGAAFIDLAILTVMVTPLAAVIAIAVGFSHAGERRFLAYTLAVVAILSLSIVLALLR